MHISQKILLVDLMIGLESAQCRAVFAEIFFAQPPDLRFGNAHALEHVRAHPFFERLPQPAGCGIKRVVEIEKDGGKSHQAIISHVIASRRWLSLSKPGGEAIPK